MLSISNDSSFRLCLFGDRHYTRKKGFIALLFAKSDEILEDIRLKKGIGL